MSATRLGGISRRSRPSAPDARGLPTQFFRRIRLRLIGWYSGVLALLLLIAGSLLWVGMEQTLLAPLHSRLIHTAQGLGGDWQTTKTVPCKAERTRPTAYVACFDSTGTLIEASIPAKAAPGFLDPALARAALGGHPQTDTIDAGNSLGMVMCYAMPVTDPTTEHALGVIEVGFPIEGQTQALDLLRTLLILIGLTTLAGSAIGGLFLARRALAPAQLAYSRQQDFIADASHELRTPLTLLRADAEVVLLDRAEFPARDVPLLENIVLEADRLAALVTHFLTLARLDSGQMTLAHDLVPVRDLVQDVVQRVGSLAQQGGVQVRSTAISGSLLVVGDATLLEQALLILVENAVKYNVPEGSVTVSADVQGGNIRVLVQDTGIGIAPDHLSRLGERFFRPDQARNRATGGTGLGLAIARGIVTAHGGHLTLESTEHQGTLAIISLPIAGLPTP